MRQREIISFECPITLIQRIEAATKKLEKSRSCIIRESIEHYLAETVEEIKNQHTDEYGVTRVEIPEKEYNKPDNEQISSDRK